MFEGLKWHERVVPGPWGRCARQAARATHSVLLKTIFWNYRCRCELRDRLDAAVEMRTLTFVSFDAGRAAVPQSARPASFI